MAELQLPIALLLEIPVSGSADRVPRDATVPRRRAPLVVEAR